MSTGSSKSINYLIDFELSTDDDFVEVLVQSFSILICGKGKRRKKSNYIN